MSQTACPLLSCVQLALLVALITGVELNYRIALECSVLWLGGPCQFSRTGKAACNKGPGVAMTRMARWDGVEAPAGCFVPESCGLIETSRGFFNAHHYRGVFLVFEYTRKTVAAAENRAHHLAFSSGPP